jgi:hypothetical protein
MIAIDRHFPEADQESLLPAASDTVDAAGLATAQGPPANGASAESHARGHGSSVASADSLSSSLAKAHPSHSLDRAHKRNAQAWVARPEPATAPVARLAAGTAALDPHPTGAATEAATEAVSCAGTATALQERLPRLTQRRAGFAGRAESPLAAPAPLAAPRAAGRGDRLRPVVTQRLPAWRVLHLL